MQSKHVPNRDFSTENRFEALEETNETLPERLRDSYNHQDQPYHVDGNETMSRLHISANLEQYFRNAPRTTNDDWTSWPEIPSSAELLGEKCTAGRDVCNDPNCSPDGKLPLKYSNRIEGSWNKLEYLEAHYRLLREDAIKPLRDAVGLVRTASTMSEDPQQGTLGIYSRVFIKGFTFSSRGIGVRIEFSLDRVGKNIRWTQSKRLIAGSLVVLLPVDDITSRVCKVAVVAARPLRLLEKCPPQIDLFFARSDELEVDAEREWIMIEERSGYFEAERHTLTALQRLTVERFPLFEHIGQLQKTVPAPAYLEGSPRKDISSILVRTDSDHEANLTNIDILQEWPVKPDTLMDSSQLTALHACLTKRLAIVQGPPGTGKTFVSVEALKIILDNMNSGDSSIVITCNTNHALDQLLRHVNVIEADCFVRLGGRTKDKGMIRERTLYKLREVMPCRVSATKRKAMRQLELLTKRMVSILEPLKNDFLDHALLGKLNILTENQCGSLETQSVGGWVNAGNSENIVENPLKDWLGKHIRKILPRTTPQQFGFEYEEVELAFEEVREQEAENMLGDDDEEFELQGRFVEIGDTFTGAGMALSDANIRSLLLKTQDLWKIPPLQRGAVYQYLCKRLKEDILVRFRAEAARYSAFVSERQMGTWEQDLDILKRHKVVGLTTTGFSKNRALISSLRPKIILIEEAAETLEAPVAATCVESVEHLQLQPRCHVRELEGDPYNLNVSLFERLVVNGVDFCLLKRQRRMIPEISRLLYPIYGTEIKNHADTKDMSLRPPVQGMKYSTWFFTHEYPEARDDQMSSVNQREALMIAQFVQHLVLNAISAKDITILTFYNGQRKAISRQLFDFPDLRSHRPDIQVVTVDSYQGEENGIIILSLARSNAKGVIGFLGVDNRICVALSRARRGFYLFGNGELLISENKTWGEVIRRMRGRTIDGTRRIGYALPLCCQKHNRITYIEGPEDWQKNVGGCDIPCGEVLSCGHVCPETCHPWSHELYVCTMRCARRLPCGHACAEACGDACVCANCDHFPNDYAIHERPKSSFVEVQREACNSSDVRAVQEEDLACQSPLDETAREQLRQLDEEAEGLLFGRQATTTTTDTAAGRSPQLVRTISTVNGGERYVWQTTFRPEVKAARARPREVQISLLDN